MKPDALQRRCAQVLFDDCGVQPGDGLVIGFSGGGDSTALLHLLSCLRRPYRLSLLAVYVNHGLRSALDDEVRLAARQCACLGVDLRIRAVDVHRRARLDGRGLEDAAREERLAALDQARGEPGARWIALGHTETDQVETLLQRLRRGTGLSGAACMAPRRNRFVRPLLWATRGDLRQYLRDHGLAWSEDETNKEERFERSRLRHRISPHVDHDLAAGLISDAAAVTGTLEKLEEAWVAGHRYPFQGGLALSPSVVNTLPEAFAARVVRAALGQGRTGPLPLTRRHTTDLVRLGRKSGGTSLSLPGLQAKRQGGRFPALTVSAPPAPPKQVGVVIQRPGHYRLAPLRLTVIVEREVSLSPLWGIVPEPLLIEVRNKQRGDRLLESGKKLKSIWERVGLWGALRQWVPVVVEKNRGAAVAWTALSPIRERQGFFVSFCLDHDHPLRAWLRIMRATPEGREQLRGLSLRSGRG